MDVIKEIQEMRNQLHEQIDMAFESIIKKLERQYVVTPKFAKRGFVQYYKNKNGITAYKKGGHYEQYTIYRDGCP
jgi:hypothetical protein